MLAKGYGVGEEAIATLKREAKSEETDAKCQPDLNAKTNGIYTLAESVEARAKIALKGAVPRL